MKNIVLLTSELNIEFCLSVLDGVNEFVQQHNDIHLIICQVKSKDDEDGSFSFQYSLPLDMIRAKDINGYIILSTTFGTFLSELIQTIRKKNNSPIFSIGQEVDFENCYATVCNTTEIYKTLVTHLKEKHNCKNIGFFSANDSNSKEAYERFEAYKNALAFNNIEYNPDLVLHGNFTRYYARKTILEKYSCPEDVPFDALLCANDLTADGCEIGLNLLGMSVPNDVKIIGFDDSTMATLAEPSISTVNQQIEEQGYITAELIYAKLCGEDIPKVTEVYATPLFRQSCGCVDTSNGDLVFRNQYGELVNKHENFKNYIRNYYNNVGDVRNIYVIYDFLHSNDTLEILFRNMDFIISHTGFTGISICLYENSYEHKLGEEFILPEKVNLACIYDRLNETKILQSDFCFNPGENIIPPQFDDVPGYLLLLPIYNCETTYGYFICHFTELKMEVFSIYSKIFNQIISHSAEYSRSVEKNLLLEKEKATLEKHNLDLAKQSKTDELTKLLNRRGFMEYGQQQINLSVSMENTGVVLFADLDGLKKINDTYGHKIGDQAIQLISEALRQTFRTADIIGRLSGDEFAVVAVNMAIDHLGKTREKLDSICQNFQKENNLPYTLSASLGAVSFDTNNFFLKELLIKADESLYDEKERHHARLNKIKLDN